MMHDDGKSDRPVVPVKVANGTQASSIPKGMDLWAFRSGWREGAWPRRTGARSAGRLDSAPSKAGISPGLKACHCPWFGYVRRETAGASSSKARARCGNSARRDPCGGAPARALPTAPKANPP